MHGRILAMVAAVVILAALTTNNPLLVRLGYILIAVLAVAAAITWLSVRNVEIHRHTRSSRAEVGGLAEETFSVTNRSWLPKLWLEVFDGSELPGHHASRVVSALAPGRTRSWSVRTMCRKRGVFTLGPLTLAGGDPLGMFQAERELPHTSSFIVYPRTVSLRGIDLPTGYLSGGQVIRRRAEFATTNVRGVRAYQPGDSFNRIHWPTTARRARLYTKEFELDPIADFWLLVDLDRAAHTGSEDEDLGHGRGGRDNGHNGHGQGAKDDGDHGPAMAWMDEGVPELERTTEEYAVTIAASLARHFLAAGKSVGLIAHGQRRVVVQPDRGDRQVVKILSHLAVLRAAGRAGLAQVLSAENHEFTRNTTLLVITPTNTLRWIEGLRELRFRGVSSMVVLLDAPTFGAAGAVDGVTATLAAHGVPYRLVRCGDDLRAALGRG